MKSPTSKVEVARSLRALRTSRLTVVVLCARHPQRAPRPGRSGTISSIDTWPAALAARIGPADRILVDKSERRLQLLRGHRVLRTYRVELGANPVGHKEVEGDSRSPEGEYRIDSGARPIASFIARCTYHIRTSRTGDPLPAIRRSPGTFDDHPWATGRPWLAQSASDGSVTGRTAVLRSATARSKRSGMPCRTARQIISIRP